MGTPLFTGDVFQWARFCNAQGIYFSKALFEGLIDGGKWCITKLAKLIYTWRKICVSELTGLAYSWKKLYVSDFY